MGWVGEETVCWELVDWAERPGLGRGPSPSRKKDEPCSSLKLVILASSSPRRIQRRISVRGREKENSLCRSEGA